MPIYAYICPYMPPKPSFNYICQAGRQAKQARRWKLISRLVLSVTASGKVLTAFYSCLRLNRLLTSEPQTFREGVESV